METTLYEIKYPDGRLFRVNCANKSQKSRLLKSIAKLNQSNENIVIKEITNGIHTVKQWENIVEQRGKPIN